MKKHTSFLFWWAYHLVFHTLLIIYTLLLIHTSLTSSSPPIKTAKTSKPDGKIIKWNRSFGCFFYALEGENWMTEMPENWEITDRHERTAPAIPWSSFAFFHRKYNYQLLDYLLCSRLTFSLPLNSAQVWNTTLLIPILLPVYKASNTIWTSSQMLHLCLKKLTPSFNQDCIHIRKCLMPSMREHYNTDGIRISTT